MIVVVRRGSVVVMWDGGGVVVSPADSTSRPAGPDPGPNIRAPTAPPWSSPPPRSSASTPSAPLSPSPFYSRYDAVSVSVAVASSLFPVSVIVPVFSHFFEGVNFYPQFESSDFFANDLDVVVFAVSILSFEEVLKSIPSKFLSGRLVVDVLSVKMHAKQSMVDILPPDADIL